MLKRKTRPVNLTDPPGVPCPQCRTPIRLTLDKLLAGTPVFCSECGLQLALDMESSARALEAAKTVQHTLRDLDGG